MTLSPNILRFNTPTSVPAVNLQRKGKYLKTMTIHHSSCTVIITNHLLRSKTHKTMTEHVSPTSNQEPEFYKPTTPPSTENQVKLIESTSGEVKPKRKKVIYSCEEHRVRKMKCPETCPNRPKGSQTGLRIS